ncbi:MAG: hypothetical protein K6G52_07010 [Treponemataceae bacterium]|nr:hypothetical protein [Treponemataceae bacterium]
MTLRIRNKLLLAIDIVAFVVFVTFIVAAALFFTRDGLSTIPKLERNLNLSENICIFKNSPLASMISLLIRPFYVAIFGLFIYISFEKTKAEEIIYISLYFIGYALQGFSVLIPILQLWNTTLATTIIIGRIALVGHLISGIAILLLTIMLGTENPDKKESTTDRNIWISVSISLFCAIIIPINTVSITSTFWLNTGFDVMLFVLLAMIIIISIVVLSFYSYYNQTGILKSPALYVSILEVGYLMLQQGDNYFFLVLGAVLLFSSTYALLVTIRRKYLWN